MFKNLNPEALGVLGHESEIIELALTYGFRGIDINLAAFAARVKLHGMTYARRLIASTGGRLVLGTFALPVDLESSDEAFGKEVEKLRQLGQLACEAGCTRCTTTVAPLSTRRPYHENFELHRQRLAEVGKALEPSGVRLGVGFLPAEGPPQGETFEFVHDFDALALLVKMVGAPNVGLLVDVWNIYVSGGSLQSIQRLSESEIVAVQLAEAPADRPLVGLSPEQRLLPDVGGAIDLPPVLTLLAERRYDGPVTPMPSRKRLDTSRRDVAVRAASEGLARLWRAANLTSGVIAAPVAAR